MTETKKKTAGNPSGKKKKKPRRRIRWQIILIPLVLAAAIFAAFQIPKQRSDALLRRLGYTKAEAEAIRAAELEETVLENGYYSHSLAEAAVKGDLNKKYLPLYIAADEYGTVSDKEYLLYERLADLGYEEDQIINLFSKLTYREMIPLLVFDYQWDETDYIEDCIETRAERKDGTFILNGSYRENYRHTEEAAHPSQTDVLINKNYSLPDTYEPDDLTAITTEYAVNGMNLRKEAADAALKMCMKALEEGNAFFVSGSYMNYDAISRSYNLLLETRGESAADLMLGKPGFCEFQTGLSCTFAATYEKYEDFRTTDCYKWLKKNAVSYGFIERYPEGQEDVTGCEQDASYYRYIGKDLAKSVSATGLTYDEYWSLFLKGWEDEANRPSDTLIEKALEEMTN